MAKLTPELKEHFKSLGISNGCWKGPDDIYYSICNGGAFYIHSICITRIKNIDNPKFKVPWNIHDKRQYFIDNGIDPDAWSRYVDYTPQRYHSGRNGGYLYTEYYGTDKNKFDELFNKFLEGYKEYQSLIKKEEIDEDFV